MSENAAQTNDYGYTGVQNNNPIGNELQEKIALADGVTGMTTFHKCMLPLSIMDAGILILLFLLMRTVFSAQALSGP